MSMTVEELQSEAMKLSIDSRAELLSRLLISFEQSLDIDNEVADMWTAEAARRDKEMDNSSDAGIPGDEILKELRRTNR